MRVKVSIPAWAESEKSWNLLVKKSKSGKGWSDGYWFPKSACSLEPSSKELGVGILTLPDWIYNKRKEDGAKFTTYED
jgi:hypothetical protein